MGWPCPPAVPAAAYHQSISGKFDGNSYIQCPVTVLNQPLGGLVAARNPMYAPKIAKVKLAIFFPDWGRAYRR
jgi:hypothetical protein